MKIIKTIAISTFIAATSLLCDAREFQDWSNFRRYHDSNTEVKALPAAERQVVFLGNSITDNWARFRPDFFKQNGYIAVSYTHLTLPTILLV